MARGGARNRSGPRSDELSGRSERRDYSLSALPAEGYDQPAPAFPLPRRQIMKMVFEGKSRYQALDETASRRIRTRELALWKWLWTTPQACAWSLPSERWRLHTIAMYVRTFVVCEGHEATAADKGSLHRFADQIGLTTAGLAEMGWKIAPAEPPPAERAEEESKPTASGDVVPFERRR